MQTLTGYKAYINNINYIFDLILLCLTLKDIPVTSNAFIYL